MWWKFWSPADSGVIGGLIFGAVATLGLGFVLPPILHYLSIWWDYWA